MRRAAPLVVVALLAGCGSHAAKPTLTVSPSTALVDTPIRIVVSGAKPHARVVFRASASDLVGVRFRSHLAVRANAAGDARAPMSLLSSMAPAVPGARYVDVLPWVGERVTVSADGATAHLRWLVRTPRVRETDLRPAADGFFGDFFRVPSARRRPAVLLFGGSEGRLSGVEEAALLASRDIPTLALAYFGEPGLPKTLSRVPLEYFERALRWLARQPGVDPQRLTVYGVSRGSESALLLGVQYPQLVHKVVALVPGNVVLCAYPGCGGPAWTLHGKAIPYQDEYGPDGPDTIPVERIRAPLFLDCGGGDAIWPSCEMARAIVRRRHGRAVTLLSFPDGGHAVGDLLPNVPVFSPNTEGFSPASDAAARRAAWPKLLRFLTG
jgi:dienelactone hydrolase